MDVSGGLYNLKKTLMKEIGSFERHFMFNAGLAGAKEQMSRLAPDSMPDAVADRINALLQIYTLSGFGNFRIDRFDPDRRIVEIVSEDSAEAFAFREKQDSQTSPVCSCATGILTWIVRVALDPSSPDDSDLLPLETECMAAHGKVCRFVIAPEAYLRKELLDYKSPMRNGPEQDLKFNEEILEKNLELQGLNLSLERQVRKKTEDLWKSEDNYKSLISILPDPVAIFSSDGNLVSLNPAAVKLLGYDSPEEALAVDANLVMAGGRRDWEKVVWLLEKEGAVRDHEIDLLRRDGKTAIVQLTARFAELPQGRCVEAILRDITDRRALEESMREAQTESEHLNDLMSHDVMNYTFAALHYLEKLRQASNLDEEQRKELGLVTKEIQGAFELSASVRDLARIRTLERGEGAVLDLKLLIGEAAESAKRMFSDKKVRIDFQKPSDPCYAKCNTLVTNLFTNLMTNAIKFDYHPEVVIDVTVESLVLDNRHYWRVKVTDRGRGIPDNEKEKVFERFHRVDRSVPGSGLGLYVVRYIATACGGKVWAENRVPNDPSKGTTMVVMLQKADARTVAKLSRKGQ